MTVFLNGQFVPEDQAVVSVFDRGFVYGDGVFEAVRVVNRRPFRLAAHLERFEKGAAFLKIRPAFDAQALGEAARQLIASNGLADAILRIVLSRGPGQRGYSPKNATRPTLVMSLHPLAPLMDPAHPPEWRIITSTMRLPAGHALAQFKTCNKLAQVLARAEADEAGADEAILPDTNGDAVESSSGNLFWIADKVLCTPPLASSVLPGVTRAVVLELAHKLRLQCRETGIQAGELSKVEGVFLSQTSVGLAECVELDGRRLARSPVVPELCAAYWNVVRDECSCGQIR
jgi:aminodeoxychorismate lyase